MKKTFRKLLLFCILAGMLLTAVPQAFAYAPGDPYRSNLRAFIRDTQRRQYVEMMLDYHVRTDRDIQNALDSGFCAVFLFDGCSDNMKDPELSDLSYYRVSGVCIVLKKHASGEIRMVYFNNNASTIPDRPLEYGAWALPEVGEVGPATICDGTYQVYSVRHKGEYEALHVRTDYWDATLDAVYMHPTGFVTSRASEINVHTRTSNHISGRGMWSAGCPLVGGGTAWEFQRLMYSAYHTTYDSFEVDNFVGTLTIDRQQLRQELYTIYKDPDAVDTFLEKSRAIQPEHYLQQCSGKLVYETEETRILTQAAELMSLPCSLDEDARTETLKTIPEGQPVTVTGSIRNPMGSKWLMVSWDGTEGYLFNGYTKPESWKDQLRELFLGETS